MQIARVKNDDCVAICLCETARIEMQFIGYFPVRFCYVLFSVIVFFCTGVTKT